MIKYGKAKSQGDQEFPRLAPLVQDRALRLKEAKEDRVQIKKAPPLLDREATCALRAKTLSRGA